MYELNNTMSALSRVRHGRAMVGVSMAHALILHPRTFLPLSSEVQQGLEIKHRFGSLSEREIRWPQKNGRMGKHCRVYFDGWSRTWTRSGPTRLPARTCRVEPLPAGARGSSSSSSSSCTARSRGAEDAAEAVRGGKGCPPRRPRRVEACEAGGGRRRPTPRATSLSAATAPSWTR